MTNPRHTSFPAAFSWTVHVNLGTFSPLDININNPSGAMEKVLGLGFRHCMSLTSVQSIVKIGLCQLQSKKRLSTTQCDPGGPITAELRNTISLSPITAHADQVMLRTDPWAPLYNLKYSS